MRAHPAANRLLFTRVSPCATRLTSATDRESPWHAPWAASVRGARRGAPLMGATRCGRVIPAARYRYATFPTCQPGRRRRCPTATKSRVRDRNRTRDDAAFIAQTKFADRSDSMRFEGCVTFDRPPMHGTHRCSPNDASGPIARAAARLSASRPPADGASVAVVKRSLTNRAGPAIRTIPEGGWFEYCCIERRDTHRVRHRVAVRNV